MQTIRYILIVTGSIVVLVSLSVGQLQGTTETNGGRLYRMYCSSCHHPTKIIAAPPIAGVRERWRNAGIEHKIYQWIKNPKSVLQENHPYVINMVSKSKSFAFMTAQPLTNSQIDAVLEYVDGYKGK